MSSSTELPILPFESKKKFADWLAKNHDKSTGLWLKIAKKAETREKCIRQFVEMLVKGETF